VRLEKRVSIGVSCSAECCSVSNSGLIGESIPLLDLVKASEEGDRDEDDDCFLAVADFELDFLEVSRLYLSVARSSIFRERILPHEQIRTAKASMRSSCQVCWFRGRRSRSRCWSPALKDVASMGWSPQSC